MHLWNNERQLKIPRIYLVAVVDCIFIRNIDPIIDKIVRKKFGWVKKTRKYIWNIGLLLISFAAFNRITQMWINLISISNCVVAGDFFSIRMLDDQSSIFFNFNSACDMCFVVFEFAKGIPRHRIWWFSFYTKMIFLSFLRFPQPDQEWFRDCRRYV